MSFILIQVIKLLFPDKKNCWMVKKINDLISNECNNSLFKKIEKSYFEVRPFLQNLVHEKIQKRRKDSSHKNQRIFYCGSVQNL